MSESMLGSVCRKASSGAVCFCSRDGDDKGKIVFKVDIANVFVSWGAEDRDLDICAYWLGIDGGMVGYGWGRLAEDESHCLMFYGDNTQKGGTEHLLPYIKTGWGSSEKRTVRVHLNFFPMNGVEGDGLATIRVVSSDGASEITRTGVVCGRRGGKATTDDPYVDIVFDEHGAVTRITQGGV